MVSPPTQLVRRLLEQEVGARIASVALFEAVQGRAPASLAELVALVDGPLRAVLRRKVEVARADEVIDRISYAIAPESLEMQLPPDEPATVEVSIEDTGPTGLARPKADATASWPTFGSVVSLVVLAAGKSFEGRLATALGDERVVVRTASGRAAVVRMLAEEPALVLVDASDYPRLDPNVVLAACSALPAATTCVLWGSELPFGRQFNELLDERPRPWVTLELREGIAPLLDIVRSRRRVEP